MKKALKISLITITSIFVVMVIFVSVLVWIVFTPAKLTPLVQEQASKYISCKSEIGLVELTFFSTFPEFRLKADNINLINKFSGAPSDTLLSAKTVTAGVDLKALWSNNELIINDLIFSEFKVNAYVNTFGKANYDVYISDTTSTDTSSFINSFKKIDLRNLSFQKGNITYNNAASGIKSSIVDLNGKFNFNLIENDILSNAKFEAAKLSFSLDSIEYLNETKVKAFLPLQYNLKNRMLALNNSKVELNELIANLDGNIFYNDTSGEIKTDIRFNTEKCLLAPVLKFIPKQYATSLEGIDIDGIVNTTGTINGVYNNNSLPLIDVKMNIENGTFKYADLPYKLREMFGDVDMKLDLNNDSASNIIINDFKAKTGTSDLQGNGSVNYILTDDMIFDLNMKLGLNLAELEPMMPSDMAINLSGRAQGNAKVHFKLSEAMDVNLEKMKISGKFDATNLGIVYDSLLFNADKAKLEISLPNSTNKLSNFLLATMWMNRAKITQGKNTELNILNGNVVAETTNIMNTNSMNNIMCDFNFDQLTANSDNIFANIEQTTGKLNLKANFSDTVSVPKLNCKFDVKSLSASMDTMLVKIDYPKGEFSMRGDDNYKRHTIFDIDYISTATNAKMGTQSIDARQMKVNANIVRNENEKSTILQWTPTGNISMQQGKIIANGLNAAIEIPSIQFDFKPDEYTIRRSKFIVDNSDFELTGRLWNVAKYLRNEGLLSGDFNFYSNKTDVYRLMELTNGFGVEDSSDIITESSVEEANSGPYMVPKGLDIKLHANVKEALLGFDVAQNIMGDLIINDGLLVLQDMRFSTKAAKMQLTTMYKTPRKNHLFVGMDFHMTDTEISELLKMIPDIDTIMPMLRSFGGKGNFHIAVETYLDSAYHLKKSTLRGVSSIDGQNLVLMDGETFSEIAKKLRFSKHATNKVDSLSAEFTIFKNQVDIYPFLIVMDKYKAVVSGRHNLDMTFNYHISVVDSPLPVKLGVDVKGNLDELMNSPMKCITLAPCKYSNLYRPAARKEIDTKQLEIRKMIRDALTKEVIR